MRFRLHQWYSVFRFRHRRSSLLRLPLARALYQDADIYLLDDPFSDVDAHTGSELFKEYILSALATKTVIFVTHQVEFLPAADLGFFVILSWMPIYFNTIYRVDLGQASWFSAVPWSMIAVVGYFAGVWSDTLIKRGTSVTLTRKIMQAAQRKGWDILNTVGLSNSILKLIERRNRGDRLIKYAGIIITIVILFAFIR